jgi:hypothetical protein
VAGAIIAPLIDCVYTMRYDPSMLKLIIAEPITKKLADKHNVTRKEIEQCFLNRELPVLIDDLEDHRTDLPSLFFISHTNAGWCLKVVYIQKWPSVIIKTCFEPTEAMMAVYRQLISKESTNHEED